MYQVVLGQDNDDFVGAESDDPWEAKRAAEDWLKKIKKNGASTYVYIVTPAGSRVYPPFEMSNPES